MEILHFQIHISGNELLIPGTNTLVNKRMDIDPENEPSSSACSTVHPTNNHWDTVEQVEEEGFQEHRKDAWLVSQHLQVSAQNSLCQ